MFHTFLNRKIQRGIIKIMNILYKIGDLYNLLVDALFWLLYDKIGIEKVKRFYLNVLILISIPTLLLVMLSFVFSLELAFDPYRLVGIFGKKTYSMLIVRVASYAEIQDPALQHPDCEAPHNVFVFL